MDEAKFPDMKAMTDVAHSLNLTAGWYGNNCDCKDHCSDVECFAGDVNATLAFGFVSAAALLVQQSTNTLILVQDSIKLDGCGIEEDVALWSEMFNHSIRLLRAGGDKEKKGMMIENCHSARSLPAFAPGGCCCCCC